MSARVGYGCGMGDGYQVLADSWEKAAALMEKHMASAHPGQDWYDEHGVLHEAKP